MRHLSEIKNEIEEIKKEIIDLTEKYNEEKAALERVEEKLNREYACAIEGVDFDRIKNAERFVYTRGFKRYYGFGETGKMLNDCIKDLACGSEKILTEYYGCKNYFGFMCQRTDCRYGYGPTHGDIVCTIGATSKYRKNEITPSEEDMDDILYYLEKMKEKAVREILG